MGTGADSHRFGGIRGVRVALQGPARGRGLMPRPFPAPDFRAEAVQVGHGAS